MKRHLYDTYKDPIQLKREPLQLSPTEAFLPLHKLFTLGDFYNIIWWTTSQCCCKYHVALHKKYGYDKRLQLKVPIVHRPNWTCFAQAQFIRISSRYMLPRDFFYGCSFYLRYPDKVPTIQLSYRPAKRRDGECRFPCVTLDEFYTTLESLINRYRTEVILHAQEPPHDTADESGTSSHHSPA